MIQADAPFFSARKIKSFLKDWILPSGFVRLLVSIRSRRDKKFKKNWSYEPLDFGLHELRHFRNIGKAPQWRSLNKESRPAIVLDRPLSFQITSLLNPEAEQLQLGLGVIEGQRVDAIRIYLDGELQGEIRQIVKGQWHDLRVPLGPLKDSVLVKVDWKGEGSVCFSHPAIVGRAPKNNRAQIRNIICVIVDGITPDLLLMKESRFAPNINKFFSEGVFCHRVYSQGNWTLPAFSSMLTGVYPSRHGVNHPDRYETPLPPHFKTLPEVLQENGFRTFGYSGNRRFSPAYGHAKGFERFIFNPPERYDSYASSINEAILHLEAHQHDSNFIFLHLFDAHAPYQGRSYLQNVREAPIRHNHSYKDGKRRGFEGYAHYLQNEWQSKMCEVDCGLGALFSYIEKNEWLKNALIVLTSDHGTFYEGSGKILLAEEGVSIPLLVKGPHLCKKSEYALIAGSVDLMPSLLHLAGVPIPDGVDGRNWPFLGAKPRNEVLSEALYGGAYQASVRDEDCCYHFQYPCDERSGKIDFDRRNPVLILKRENGKDTAPVNDLNQERMEDVYLKLEKYHRSSSQPKDTALSAINTR